MKVVDISEYWSERGGGVRTYLTAKARSLCELGVDHRVLAPGPRSEESRLLEDRDGSMLVRYAGVPLPYDASYRLFSGFRRAARRTEREKPDVVEVHSPDLAAISALSVAREAFGVRTFLWHSDTVDSLTSDWLVRFAGRRAAGLIADARWGWIRALAARSDATIVASACTARKLRNQRIPRVREIPFGIDKAVFRPALRSQELRRELLGPDADTLLVSAGRFAFEKDWPVVLAAVQRVARSRRVRLVLAGDGPERRRLEALAGPETRILPFDRDRERFARLLASADALVHAGPIETFCFAAAEAVAVGTPVIVPDRGAALERRALDCSELFRAGSAEALAAAIERLLSRDPVELRRRALEAARTARSERQHFEELLGLYAELLNQKKAGKRAQETARDAAGVGRAA